MTQQLQVDIRLTQNESAAAKSRDEHGDEADSQLAQRALHGDMRAFELIMRRYNQRLFRLARGIVSDAGEAEDALQEAYVKAFYALSGYASRGNLGAWLAQIVRHEAIDRVRARTAQRKYLTLESDLSSDDDESPLERHESPQDDVGLNPQAATENAEMRQVIEDAIATLPDTFRCVFMLREVEGLSIEETAEYLGIPTATVKTRDHRARNLLRQRLSQRIDSTVPNTFQFLAARCDALVARVLSRLQQ